MRLTFTVKVHPKSDHRVEVSVHSSRRAMRACLRKLRHPDPRHTEAACWQVNPCGKRKGLIAEIHLCRDLLTLENIAHECLHAAHHRACLWGVPKHSDDFEETVAYDVGRLTNSIALWLNQNKILVKFQETK